MIDAGDLTEGTIYSEGSPIRGQYIYELAKYIKHNSLVIGNHDIGNADRVNWLIDNQEELFGDKFLASNVFRTEDNQRVGNLYSYQTLSNGLRVLSIGYLYYSSTTFYPNTYVEDPVSYTNSSVIQEVIEQYCDKTDFFVLNLHMSSTDSNAPKLHKLFRDYFTQYCNHSTLPISISLSHDHVEHPYDSTNACEGDTNCIANDGSHYLLYMNQYSLTFGFNSSNNNLSYLADTWYWSPQYFEVSYIASNGTETGLISRFPDMNLTLDTFDTENGLKMRQAIYDVGEKLGVNNTVGYANTTYSKSGSISSNTSLVYLYMYGVMKDVVIDWTDSLQSNVLLSTGSFRDNLPQGNISNYTAYDVYPFFNTFQYFKNVSCPVINCIMNELTSNGTSTYYAEYFNCTTENISYMNFISDDYYLPRAQEYASKCNATDEEVTIYNYTPATADVTDTFSAYYYYITHFMQDYQIEEELDINTNNTLSQGSIIAISVVSSIVVLAIIAGIITFVVKKMKKQQQYEKL